MSANYHPWQPRLVRCCEIAHETSDLNPGVSDIAFSKRSAAKYLDHLVQPELGDFHLVIAVKDLAQFARAFDHVAGRSEPAERSHFGVQFPGAKCPLRALPRFP